jgi:hypothetical protein
MDGASSLLPDGKVPLAVPGKPPSTRLGAPIPVPFLRPQPLRRVPGPSLCNQTNDVQTVTVTFPANLKPSPVPVEISDPGLLGKKISDLYEIIDANSGYSSSNSRLTFGGQFLDVDQTLTNYGVSSGDAVMVMPGPGPAPRKPVIYLYPPSSLSHVAVQLSLASSWRFSAVYPQPQSTTTPDEHQSNQSLTWTIAAEPDGTLVDKTTGTEVSYLFWEAV